MSKLQLIANAALAGLLIVGYVVLTALGDDGTTLLALLGGQALSLGVTKGSDLAGGPSG